MKPFFREILALILGIAGGALAAVTWFIVMSFIAHKIDDRRYPGGPGGLPNELQMGMACGIMLGFPIVALIAGVAATRYASRKLKETERDGNEFQEVER